MPAVRAACKPMPLSSTTTHLYSIGNSHLDHHQDQKSYRLAAALQSKHTAFCYQNVQADHSVSGQLIELIMQLAPAQCSE